MSLGRKTTSRAKSSRHAGTIRTWRQRASHLERGLKTKLEATNTNTNVCCIQSSTFCFWLEFSTRLRLDSQGNGRHNDRLSAQHRIEKVVQEKKKKTVSAASVPRRTRAAFGATKHKGEQPASRLRYSRGDRRTVIYRSTKYTSRRPQQQHRARVAATRPWLAQQAAPLLPFPPSPAPPLPGSSTGDLAAPR